ncbi:unnamed protein product, partial [Strongylus vulgaris]
MEAIYSGVKLSAPVVQYRDYAWRTSKVFYEEQLIKWKEKLNNREFQLLPTDRPRAAKRTCSGSSFTKIVPPYLQQCLRDLQKETSCTEFCILVAIYKFLIFKTTGIAEFPIGFPSSMRDMLFQKTVGCFINTIPLLGEVYSSATIIEYLASVSSAISEARNSHIPFDVLVSELNLERDDGVTPLFQVMLVADKVQKPLKESGITFLELPTRFSKYEQIWYFRYDGESLRIIVEYNCRLFLENTIVDLVNRFLYILQEFGRSSSALRLNEVTLTTKSEVNAILRKKAAHVCDIPPIVVPQMMQENLFTQSTILSCGQNMSYAKLDKRSSQLALQIANMYCIHYGELPSRDRCGAVFMDRSLDLLVVVFAIWKCGLQVVPFSLDWPVRRALETMRMFKNPILVTTGFEEVARSTANNLYPVFQTFNYNTSHVITRNLIDVSDLAYITCTSGTTGIPKLVCTEFSGHCNLVVGYTKNFNINHTSCIYQVVNYGFDIFFADLSKTLANGASMILASELIPKIDEMQDVTNAYIMPAYLSSLSFSDIKRMNFLESVQFGGEAIQTNALEHLLQTDIHLYQEHGVTEQTVFTTANRMKQCTPISEIGKPYSNLYLLTRDSDGQILPEKYQGVCYVTGLGITRGYYGMPALNCATISYGLFGKEFKTGDIAKYQHGRLHFVGRADLQVKIRGKVVDLNE